MEINIADRNNSRMKCSFKMKICVKNCDKKEINMAM